MYIRFQIECLQLNKELERDGPQEILLLQYAHYKRRKFSQRGRVHECPGVLLPPGSWFLHT